MGELPNPGDLAFVIRRVCCDKQSDAPFVGTPVRVTALFTFDADASCAYCGHEIKGSIEIAATTSRHAFPRANLRRIPPLSQLESVDIADELDAEKPRERVKA